MEVEPTFSFDKDVVTKFGTKGMQPWKEVYGDFDIKVLASPPSSSDSEWKGEEPRIKVNRIVPVYNPNSKHNN